jgi:UDP-3-O-acyl-N-acetylglucosamine deacetylase
MPAFSRRTLRGPAVVRGPALFTGADAVLTILPAPPGTGLRIRTAGQDTPATIAQLSDRPVHPVFAQARPRCTSLDAGDRTVATVEHALSALAGLGVTDAVLVCDGPEMPIADGSAAPFVAAVLRAGLSETGQTVEPITLSRPITITDADATITAEPCDVIDYAYELDYGPGSPIPSGAARWLGDPDDYRAGVAPARTFSTLDEADQMKALGLFARFTPADLLVIGPEGPVDNAWRFPDECARHKLLDLIGDLALLGRPLRARVRAQRSGHAHTHRLSRAILEQLDA